jgi:hypothetical protein
MNHGGSYFVRMFAVLPAVLSRVFEKKKEKKWSGEALQVTSLPGDKWQAQAVANIKEELTCMTLWTFFLKIKKKILL